MAIGSSQWMYSSGDYEIDQSLRIDSAANAYLDQTIVTTGNRRTATFSAWIKIADLKAGVADDSFIWCVGGTGAGGMAILLKTYNDTDTFTINAQDQSGNQTGYVTPGIYRDTSAWYHILLAYDNTNSTVSERVIFYVNGERVISSGASKYPQLNYDSNMNLAGQKATLGKLESVGRHFGGYYSEVNFIDGQALTPSSFGETGDYGEWKPTKYAGTYGTNGFYLPFEQDYTVEGFSTVTYRGNGLASQYIGGVGFSPDLSWIKSTVANTGFNVVERQNASAYWRADNTSPEGSANIVTAWSADGFTVGNGNGFDVNKSGERVVAWNWDMGGTAVTNTNGGISATVRANPSYGQSIIRYTGTGSASTVGHGLTSAPNMIICKSDTNGYDWPVYHSGLASTSHTLTLNLDNISGVETNKFNGTAPTNSVFSVGTHGTNVNGATQIAFCFHDVAGYSKFGSYTGNGTTNNQITTGFKPALVIIKNTAANYRWYILDNNRDATNPAFHRLFAGNTQDESTNSTILEFNDTGFKLITSDAEVNQNNSNHVYMAFADTREYAYWLDQSGNNNDWTSNNLTESDVMVDSPTNNFCTMNPLASGSGAEPDTNTYTTKEGNLESKWTGIASAKSYATIAPTDGKWYWEFFIKTQAETARGYVGLCEFEDCDINGTGQSGDSNYHIAVGNYSRVQAYGNEFDNVYPTPAQYDVYSIAIDWSASPSKFWFRINGGAWQGGGNPATGATPTKSYNKTIANASMMPYHGSGSGSASNVSEIVFNFGSDSSFAGNKTPQGNQDGNDIGDFYYAPPTGFLALCTKNLPSADVIPSEHFNTVLYSGNQGANVAVTGVGFEPSLIWGKNRSGASNHWLFDSVRGTTKMLQSDQTTAEETQTGVTAFNSDGFTLGNWIGSSKTNDSYAAWNWKAGGSASSNTNGSITSSVSANVDAGFSIVTYSGASNATSDSSNNGGAYWTIGHGLAQAPEVVMVKKRDGGTDNNSGWYMGHQGLSATPWASGSHVVLNTTAANANESNILWGNRAPTSTTFSAGAWNVINHTISGTPFNYLAYCFHSVDDHSKVGSYTGNGNADGTFVYTGFRPAYVMYKRTNSTGNWGILDNTRDTTNPQDLWMAANLTNTESSETSRMADFLSNGFKFRGNAGDSNASGGTYIYIAFAETPFKHSNAR